MLTQKKVKIKFKTKYKDYFKMIQTYQIIRIGMKKDMLVNHMLKDPVEVAGLLAQQQLQKVWQKSKELIKNYKNILSNSFLTVMEITMGVLEVGCIKDLHMYPNLEF